MPFARRLLLPIHEPVCDGRFWALRRLAPAVDNVRFWGCVDSRPKPLQPSSKSQTARVYGGVRLGSPATKIGPVDQALMLVCRVFSCGINFYELMSSITGHYQVFLAIHTLISIQCRLLHVNTFGT